MNWVLGIESVSIEHTSHNRADFARIPIIAHQGGWDEALLVGTPLVLIGLLLWIANRRVSAQLAAAEAAKVGAEAAGADNAAPNDQTDTP
ncbi:MAG: hypothetical protein R2710_16850 [Acidimicrobiales bacterium]